jgi:hypothetical protein
VIRITRRLFGRGGRDRLIWLVNLALIFTMTLRVASGILISRVALNQLGMSSQRSVLEHSALHDRHTDP